MKSWTDSKLLEKRRGQGKEHDGEEDERKDVGVRREPGSEDDGC